MTVDYKNVLVNNYYVPGVLCNPTSCTQAKPFQSSFSAGVPWLVSYWTQQ
jgi:hypothetical protein